MIEIRRVFTHVEHIHHEFGSRAEMPLVRGAIGAVLTNPFAGRYEPDILPMMALLHPLHAAMDVPLEQIAPYGKGAIVGADGELEHGALWHVPGGYAMRELLGWKAERSADARSADGTKDTKGTKDTQAPPGPRGGGAGPQCLAHRAGHEEGRRAGLRAGCAADPYQRQLCAQPLRHHRVARARRAGGR